MKRETRQSRKNKEAELRVVSSIAGKATTRKTLLAIKVNIDQSGGELTGIVI